MARRPTTEDKEAAENKTASYAPAEGPAFYYPRRFGSGWLAAAVVLIVIMILFLFGAAAANYHYGRHGNYYMGGRAAYGPMGMVDERDGFGGGLYSSGSRASGVVTAVNGSDFTLAGNGSTTKVTTNGSTQYQNGNQVKQNDTVIVFGSFSGGTLTASRIIINP